MTDLQNETGWLKPMVTHWHLGIGSGNHRMRERHYLRVKGNGWETEKYYLMANYWLKVIEKKMRTALFVQYLSLTERTLAYLFVF